MSEKAPYLQVFRVAVPPNIKWQPNLAHQLMVSLFSASSSLVLGIAAQPNQIYWYLEVNNEAVETVTQTLYSVFPQAHITTTPKTSAHIGYRRYPLHLAKPFMLPLKYASDFGNLDPLTTLISGLAQVTAGETIVYELALTSPNPKYLKLGEKLYQERAEQVNAPTYKVWRGKLDAPLKEVSLAVKVKTNQATRANDLAASLWPAFALFEWEGFNRLVAPGDQSYQPVLSPAEVAALWHLPTDQMQTSGLVWAKSAQSPIPNQVIRQNQGVILGTNSYQGHSHPVRLAYEDRVTHVNLVGRTRVGKSTLLHHMIHQDIEAGKGVAVIDPHGDLIEAILSTSIPKNREQAVVLFDVRDQAYPIGLNLLTTLPGVNQEATAGYALAVMRKMFSEQWSGGRMQTVLDAALRALVAVEGATIQDIPKLLMDPKYRREVLKQVTNPATLDYWYDEYDLESPSQQREFARPITQRIRRFYSDPITRRIVCQRSSLDFRQILDRGQIFLANLGGVADVEAETLGALLISKIQMAAMSRTLVPSQQRTPFYLYVDEVQNFITTSLSRVFSEAGKYGLSLVVANQYLKQLEGDTLEALMGNVGSTVIFRVGPEDARALAPFVRPQFTVDDLTNLDRFAAVIKMQLAGQTLPAFSMVTAPPLDRPIDAQDRIGRIRKASRKAYARPKAEVDAEIQSRYGQRELEEAKEEEKEDYFD